LDVKINQYQPGFDIILDTDATLMDDSLKPIFIVIDVLGDFLGSKGKGCHLTRLISSE
jgi:hypothetical protein